MTQRRCGECIYYVSAPDVPSYGFCHRHPPDNPRSNNRGAVRVRYPMVRPRQDWCGELVTAAHGV